MSMLVGMMISAASSPSAEPCLFINHWLEAHRRPAKLPLNGSSSPLCYQELYTSSPMDLQKRRVEAYEHVPEQFLALKCQTFAAGAR